MTTEGFPWQFRRSKIQMEVNKASTVSENNC